MMNQMAHTVTAQIKQEKYLGIMEKDFWWY